MKEPDDTWRWIKFSGVRANVWRVPASAGWTDGVMWALRSSGLVESREVPGIGVDFELLLPTRADDIGELREAVAAIFKIREL